LNRRDIMIGLKELQDNLALKNSIDWEMTPEEAVRLYLEWGNNWSRGNYVIKSRDDVTHYFVLNTWNEEPVIYLIRRNSEEAVELARIDMPDHLKKRLIESNALSKGIYSVEGEVKAWLKEQLDAA